MRFAALPTGFLAVLCLMFISAVVPAEAQKRRISGRLAVFAPIVEANAAASLEQCRNGATSPGVGCVEPGGDTGWVTGNAGFQNSHWAEDQFLTYRMLFSNLTVGSTNTVIIGYDIIHSDVHAIDYLGTYNATETNNNPCVGVSGCTLEGPTSTYPIPEDNVTVTNQINPNTGQYITQIPGEFTMWGGTITNVEYMPYTAGDVERQIKVTFTANVSNPVLAWGGHVAWQGDWGAGNSAGGIAGSPYHMRLIELNGQGGNQDRSLSADAVVPSGALFIVKEVETLDGSDSSTQVFAFTATRDFDPLQFTLVDDNDGPGVDKVGSSGITLFGTNNAITVTESVAAGWELLGISCSENKTVNSVVDVANRQVHAAVDLNEIVTCTFTNGTIAPSAAPASVTGRVTDRYGRGIYYARVQLFNALSGEVKTAYTNSFGYYRFTDLSVGDAYVMSVSHRRHLFMGGTTTFTLQADLAGVNFVAN